MNDYTDYINNSLSDVLSPCQNEEFRKHLSKDEDLRERYAILLSSREYLKAKSALEEIENDPDLPLAEKLVNDYYDRKKDPNRKRVGLKPLWITLVSTAAIIVAVFFIKTFLLIASNERLYNRFYQPLNQTRFEMEIARGTSSQHYIDGLESYLKEDYGASLNAFSREAGSSYYQGLSILGMGDYEEAIQQFEYYLIQFPYHPGANWYLALAYLQKGGYNQAIRKLEELTKTENSYRSSSRKLISRIGKTKATGGN